MGTKRRLERDQAFKSQKLAKTAQRRRRLEAEREISERVGSNRRNDLLPELRLQHIVLSGLRPSPHRSRRSTVEHVGRLTASISDLGFTVPILVRETEIVDGHVRVEAATRLGLDRVPAIEVSHLSPAEIRKLRLTLKEAGAMGGLYRSAHELIALFCKGKVPRTNNVELGRHGRNRNNVWVAPGAMISRTTMITAYAPHGRYPGRTAISWMSIGNAWNFTLLRRLSLPSGRNGKLAW
ncbi:ParB-like nuclease domain-containing protein [Sphingobium faniae]|nr:ParB-like nuclease domain-containing protein [Sphingobium faniae]